MRHQPFGVRGIAADPATQMVVYATLQHHFQRKEKIVAMRFIAAIEPGEPQIVHERRIRELWRSLDPAAHRIDQAAYACSDLVKPLDLVRNWGDLRREPAFQMVENGLRIMVNFLFILVPEIIDRVQHIDKTRHVVALVPGKVSTAPEGFAIGRRNMVSGHPPCCPIAPSAAI